MCGLWPELFFCDSDAAGLCHPLRTLGAVAEGQKPPLFSSFSPSFSFILLFWTNAIENGSHSGRPIGRLSHWSYAPAHRLPPPARHPPAITPPPA